MKQNLETMKCVACTGATPVLSRKSISMLLKRVPGWRFTKGKIKREFILKNFKGALDVVNRIGAIAEHEGHHPDIFMHDWNKVTVTLYTHAINRLSENDFIVAAKINALKV